MKRVTIFLFIFFSITSLYSQQFHSLDGIEDEQGNTLLLYRFGQQYFPFNPVYKFNTNSLDESLLIQAFYSVLPGGDLAKAVNDFEFFPNDVDNFMNVGYTINPDNHSYIARNDSVVFGGIDGFERVDISKQNPQKVFVFGAGYPIRSWDGGYTFPLDSIGAITNFIPFTLSDFDDQIMFGIDEFGNFARNSETVDTSAVYIDQNYKMYFDANQFHIYRVNKTYGGYSLNVSNNKGDAFTWNKTYQSENPIFITIDSTQSGVVYLADGRKIYKSVNNGYSFSEYKSLPGKLIGIYKKPNSEIIYAASKRNIYKITSDSVTIIKSLPIPEDEFNWFPLAIGNKWIYKAATLDDNCFWITNEWEESNIITKDTVINELKYFKFEPPLGNEFEFARIDSVEGKLKVIYSYSDSAEVTLYDFLMEVGDTIILDPADPYGGYILTDETSSMVFGESRLIRNFSPIWFIPSFTLVKGLGYYRDWYCEFGGMSRGLKGCVINDIVYGDTTFTDVDEENSSIPTEYKLEQNYPNPFNPSTVISYQLPMSGSVTLKVFDVLGREVATLENEEKLAGNYEVNFDALRLSSGIYLYQLRSGQFVDTRKMTIIK
jgi:hypothetical protein